MTSTPKADTALAAPCLCCAFTWTRLGVCAWCSLHSCISPLPCRRKAQEGEAVRRGGYWVWLHSLGFTPREAEVNGARMSTLVSWSVNPHDR